MKVCGIVVTYYPDIQECVRNIRQYIDGIDHLIIWQNTPHDDLLNYNLKGLDEYADKIEFKGTGKNEGISYALNYALNYAYDNGYTHLLTMDQDSYWIDFSKYINSVSDIDTKALCGPRINNENVAPQSIEPEYIITSGMIVPVKEVMAIGGYEKNFIVDGIDTDLCYKAKEAGIKILKITEGKLCQKFGTPQKKRFLYKEFSTSGYSAFRLYGIARNHVIIIRKYKTSFSFKKDVIKRFILLFSLKILLGDSNKREKLSALWRGVLHGLKYRIK